MIARAYLRPMDATMSPTSHTAMTWAEQRPRSRPRPADALVAITSLAIALLASLASLGCDRRPPPAPILVPSSMPAPAPSPPIASAPASSLCITEGAVRPTEDRATVREPATRGFLAGSTGDAATLAFTYRGRSQSVAAFASGDLREQLGLKLRAQDSCNVIYVMWRIEPTSEIVVQVKRNEAREHRECGNDGYARVRPAFRAHPPALGVPEWGPTAARDGGPLDARSRELDHELRASIVDDTLEVFADTTLVWRGTLPSSARELVGPAGFRTDNVDIDLSLRAPTVSRASSCPTRPRNRRDRELPAESPQ
ncbi:MAG: hypothetical protein AB7T06_47935 [Kofleriaceae bacterium]